MAVVMRITKTKGATTKKFVFNELEIKSTGNPNTNIGVSLSLPKDDPSDNIESFDINLGVDKELTCEFKIYDENVDRSEGTESGGVYTFGEILDYLEYVIFYPGVGIVNYQVEITDKFRTRTDIYSFEDFNIDIDSGLYPKGNFKLKWKKRVV